LRAIHLLSFFYSMKFVFLTPCSPRRDFPTPPFLRLMCFRSFRVSSFSCLRAPMTSSFCANRLFFPPSFGLRPSLSRIYSLSPQHFYFPSLSCAFFLRSLVHFLLSSFPPKPSTVRDQLCAGCPWSSPLPLRVKFAFSKSTMASSCRTIFHLSLCLTFCYLGTSALLQGCL